MPISPDLSLPLAQPITLTHWVCSHLVTLMDAAILIRDLEQFRQFGRTLFALDPCGLLAPEAYGAACQGVLSSFLPQLTRGIWWPLVVQPAPSRSGAAQESGRAVPGMRKLPRPATRRRSHCVPASSTRRSRSRWRPPASLVGHWSSRRRPPAS